jgi:hypothetical protein
VVRCPDLGLPESLVELDGGEIRRAAERVVVLWPWEPSPERSDLQARLPDLPDDSWFARR